MKNNEKIEVDFTDQIKGLASVSKPTPLKESEAGVLDRVTNYVFTSKEAAADKAKEIGFVSDKGQGLFHSLQYRDVVVFMPGKIPRISTSGTGKLILPRNKAPLQIFHLISFTFLWLRDTMYTWNQ